MQLSRSRLVLTVMLLLTFAALSIIPVTADMSNPTQTRVLFEKGGVPYNGSVNFTMDCYGYRIRAPERPNTSEPAKIVFSFSADCPNSECIIHEQFYLNYVIIDRCDITGTTMEGKFKIVNFSSTPISKSACHYKEDERDENDPPLRLWHLRECELIIKIPADQKINNGQAPSPAHNKTGDSLLRKDEPGIKIPADQKMNNVQAPSPAHTPVGPAESLYCSIMNFFGVLC